MPRPERVPRFNLAISVAGAVGLRAVCSERLICAASAVEKRDIGIGTSLYSGGSEPPAEVGVGEGICPSGRTAGTGMMVDFRLRLVSGLDILEVEELGEENSAGGALESKGEIPSVELELASPSLLTGMSGFVSVIVDR